MKATFDSVFTQLTEGDLTDEIIASLQLKENERPAPLDTPYVFPIPRDEGKDVFSYKLVIW